MHPTSMPRTFAVLLAATLCSLSFEPRAAALEEVIVNAQKREQSLQDVPLAITAFSQELMVDRNVYDLLDLQRLMPSMSFVKGYNRANGAPLLIRGMGTVAAQPAFEGSVGTYVDGVYRSRSGMVLSSMLDVAQVEVLRGPQGTLFGKNTTAGALVMTSREPADAFAAGAELTVGDYERRRFNGYVTGALSDTVTGRLALLHDQRDGFIEALYEHDDYNDLDIFAAKLSLVWEPGDDLVVKLIADVSDSEEVCCFGNPVWREREMSLTGGPFNDYYREAAQAQFNTDVDLIALDPRERQTQNNVQPANDNREEGLVLDISYLLANGSLRSLTGLRNWEYSSRGDFDFGPVDIGTLREVYDVDSWSQEFNFTGAVENLGIFSEVEYTTGVFYAFEAYEQHRTFDAGVDQSGIWELFWPVQAGVSEPVLRSLLGGGAWATPGMAIGDVLHNLETETAAVYAHVTASFNEHLAAVLGVRYSDEEKTLDRANVQFSSVEDYASYLQQYMLGGYVLGANIAGPDIDGLTYSDAEWTYEAKLQYFMSADVQMYGSYSRGFKSGGIGMDPEAGGGQPSGQNSQLLLDLAGIGNGTGFADTDDPTYDTEYVDTWELGLKADVLAGAGRVNLALFYSDIQDIQFSVFSGTGFTVFNASDSEITGVELESFWAATQHLRLGASVTWLDAHYGDDIPPPADAGRDLTYAPEWAGSFSLDYSRPLSATLAGFVSASLSYRGNQYLSYDIQDRASDYSLLGLQAGVRSQDAHWDVRIWCDNCLDERYATGFFNQPFYFDDNLEQYQGQFVGSPRTMGLTLRYSN